jgi:hypothetical protein
MYKSYRTLTSELQDGQSPTGRSLRSLQDGRSPTGRSQVSYRTSEASETMRL